MKMMRDKIEKLSEGELNYLETLVNVSCFANSTVPVYHSAVVSYLLEDVVETETRPIPEERYNEIRVDALDLVEDGFLKFSRFSADKDFSVLLTDEGIFAVAMLRL
jgi:hypothetical protein